MTRLCRDVSTSLGRPLHTLSEAERLHLEQHLSECVTCRHESSLARAVSDLIRSVPGELSDSARERAIARAFERAATAAPRSPSARWGQRAGLALAAAAVLLLGLRVLLVDSKGSERVVLDTPGAPAARPVASASTPPVPERSAQGDQALDSGWIESASAESRTFGGARVTLATGTRVRFERAANTLELARGQVTLDVAHQHERPFAVLTQGFRVEVLGTQFVVSPEHVEVLRGHVQIRERESDALISDLHSGESYRRPTEQAPASTERVVTQRAAQPPGKPGRRAPRAAHKSVLDLARLPAAAPAVDAADSRGAHADSASQLIREARAALGEGEVASARALIERAGRAAPRVSEQAELATLDAECELLAQNPEAAIRAYLRVADRFASLRAGENALFAAAQLSLQKRDPGAARGLFERYLARYPTGRFADEARAHLQAVR